MQLYKIKLNEKHSAKENQVVNGYLGNNFESGLVALYARSEALKKAITFDGKIEKHGKKYSANEYKLVTFKSEEIGDVVKRHLIDRALVVDHNALISDAVYNGDVFNDILTDIMGYPEALQLSDEILDELYVLDTIAQNYDYIMITPY